MRSAAVTTPLRTTGTTDAITTATSSSTTTMAEASPLPSIVAPLADFPMRRLKLPRMAAGREYVIVQLKIDGKGPYDFMVDTGLTAELITPHLQKSLGIGAEKSKEGASVVVEGLGAGGKTAPEKFVELSGVTLCSDYDLEEEQNGYSTNTNKNKEGSAELVLPKLHAIVTDFSQEHMDPMHDPVEGMLGMEMLELFDVDFDFPAGRLRFWAPGTAAAVAKRDGLVEIPAAVINESLLLGIRVTSGKQVNKQQQPPKTKAATATATATARTSTARQPFIGIIDCGSSFSAVNWAAAELLDLPPKSKKLAYLGSPVILGVGVDKKPLPLPTKTVQFTFVGDYTQDEKTQNIVKFEQPPDNWKPWKPTKVGIGDLPIFELLLGEENVKFKGPAAVIGMDILSQRRIILETCKGTLQCSDRRRRIFVSPE